MLSNSPIISDFLALANREQFPFFNPNCSEPLVGINYLPRLAEVKKEDFLFLGVSKNYGRLEKSFYIWKVIHNQPVDNQPIVCINEENFSPNGVIAQNFRQFLSLVIFPQSIRQGLKLSYQYFDNINNAIPSGRLDWEIDQFLDADKANNHQATQHFLAFLANNQLEPQKDVYKTIFEAVNLYPKLDTASSTYPLSSSAAIFQLSKNFPDMQMPPLVENFYRIVYENNISLPEFEDDNDNHISQSGIIPHFVPATHAHFFVKLGLTGSGGYYAIWRIFEDKPLVENPVVYLDSEASPVAVIARNFEEYICLTPIDIHGIIYGVESDSKNLDSDYDEDAINGMLQDFIGNNREDEEHPDRAQLYFNFIEQNTPTVADKSPVEIIKRAYAEMPNLLDWLKVELPDMWDY